MDPKLFIKAPPALDPAWLAHEKAANLLAPKPVITDPKELQEGYSKRCKDLNAELLSGRDACLTTGIKIHDTQVRGGIAVRSYNPSSRPDGPPPLIRGASASSKQEGDLHPTIVYFHGGGLYVGDLDSEDLTCRRICKALDCTVYSVNYPLMPHFTAEDALSDAQTAFREIMHHRKASRPIVMGSSSGGQLAAQVAQTFQRFRGPGWDVRIHGVLLRGPVTCDATEEGANLGEKWRERHFSMSTPFHTFLLQNAAVNNSNRTVTPMPLEAENLSTMPRHWIQVCTNDIYYSDGVCYAAALEEAGVEVKLDVVEGWPHTFWLKAPYLERAVQAENDMLEGLRWLIESEVKEDVKERRPRKIVPFTDEEFKKQFMNV